MSHIEKLINSFEAWYKGDKHSELEDAYPELNNKSFLESLDRDAFVSFFVKFVKEGGGIQSGGHRAASRFEEMLNSNFSSFRQFALLPYDEDFNVSEWLTRLSEFSHFGIGAATIYLNRIDKNYFSIVNDKTQNALTVLGYNIPRNKTKAYKSIHNAQLDLQKRFATIKNFYVADSLNDFLVGAPNAQERLDPTDQLIEKYKNHIRENGLESELYKWKLLDQYKGRVDTDAVDFQKEIKEVDYNNLIYAMSKAVVNKIAKTKAEELRSLFKVLFDESIDLKDRISSFSIDTLSLYKEIDGQHSHHQDERSMATYLTYHNPEKYTFYKYSFYEKYCQLLDIDLKGKDERYVHYMELIEKLIGDYINVDKELIKQVRDLIPDYYDGENHMLLAQDILFQIFEKNETNYWVFQGNPKEFDIERGLREELTDSWKVTAHKDEIKENDKVILYITGKEAGCYALADVTSNVYEEKPHRDDVLWKEGSKGEYAVDIEFTHNLVDNPILKDELLANKGLKKLKIGNQGTNFAATKVQYETILSMIDDKITEKRYWLYSPGQQAKYWDEFYEDGIMGLGWDELGDLSDYSSKDEIVSKLQELESVDTSKKNDATANDDFVNNINVGDVIIVKKGKNNLLGYGVVESKYYYNETRPHYQKCRNVRWQLKGEWQTPFSLPVKTLTDVTKYAAYSPDFEKYYEELMAIMNDQIKNVVMHPLNQILYGPPGTGKTYELSSRYFDEYTSRKASVSREDYIKSIIEDKAWWEVLALVLLDMGTSGVDDIYKHRLLQLKASLSSSNTVRQTVWGQLQVHTVEACDNVKISKKGAPLIFNKTNDKKWEVVEDELKEQSPELIDLHQKITSFSPQTDIEIKRYEFVTFHQSFAYEDFVEGIKPDLNASNGELSYIIEDGVFKKMCTKARNDSSNSYAIFIDEINRGNVSQIFGELITLIETDKREGQENELSLILPYSKQSFSVPPNLHIIGTMNTADRSVEALDTALRRRFQFVEMSPKPEVIEEVNGSRVLDGIDLVMLLETINNRIEVLLDRDHCIGHSYFLNRDNLDSLKVAFAKQIIPLLQEYFYGDYGKIALVLGEGFCAAKEQQNVSTLFAKVQDYDADSYSEKRIFELKNPILMEDVEFKKAISLLLNTSADSE